jgi:hypothetical protein
MSREVKTGIREKPPQYHEGNWVQNAPRGGSRMSSHSVDSDYNGGRLRQSQAHSRAEQIAAAQRQQEDQRNQAVLARLPQL